jgi:hypothetical protein
MEKLIRKYEGQGQLIFEDDQVAAAVNYSIDEFLEFVPDGLGGQLPTTLDRRGRVSLVEGHPDWHPITPLHHDPLTLVMHDGRKLKVRVVTEGGTIHATGDFF